MGVAIDTIGTFITAGATNPKTLAAVTLSPGDSAQIRSFPPGQSAILEQLFYQGASKSQVRITSPVMHDNQTGITVATGESPTNLLLGRYCRQPMQPTDTLNILSGAAAGASGITALSIYYNNLTWANARLHSFGDIAGIIKSIKGMEVDCTSSATIGTWADTAVNTVDKQLHANTDYAVLGYETDTAFAVVGVKGVETANMRVCGPGSATTFPTTDYFATLSSILSTPHIPVFNSNNQGGFYVSVLANTASVAGKVYLLLAELSQTVTP